MPFICASCRRLGGVQPLCRACATVGIAVATYPEPQPYRISEAPEVFDPKRIPRIRNVADPLRSEGEWHEEIKPTNSFPILEHYWHDYPPDYPYFNDFKLSSEERSYMRTQVELEFDKMPDIDILPNLYSFKWSGYTK